MGDATTRPPSSGGRLVSLDVYRGLAVAAMIFVNAPGELADKFVYLEHKPWHGWTPTDLIFPSFLFIVGTAIPFAIGKKLERGEPRGAMVRKVLVRAAALVGMGLLGGISVDAYGSFKATGVLQRIGLCYLIAAFFYLYSRTATIAASAVAMIAGYWYVLTHVSVPGYGVGNLSPAGNLASFIDRQVLGSHMGNAVYDAEGLLSTIPAATTTMFGVLSGVWLRSGRSERAKAAGLAAVGLAGVALGLVWGRWFPLNKHIYTSSFAVFAAGASAALLALFYWWIDVRRERVGTGPLQTFGVHALLAYCASSLAQALLEQGHYPIPGQGTGDLRTYLGAHMFGWLPPATSSLAWSILWLSLWFALVKAALVAHAWLKSRRTEQAAAPADTVS